jgi:predicted HNH restriction endonuclease
MNCTWHSCTNKLVGRQLKFCSIECKNKFNVSKYRANQKLKAIEHKGGKCERCGYNTCVSALHFHHLDPTTKEFNLGLKGRTFKWSEIVKEIDKCQLLCANCHAEVHELQRSFSSLVEPVPLQS